MDVTTRLHVALTASRQMFLDWQPGLDVFQLFISGPDDEVKALGFFSADGHLSAYTCGCAKYVAIGGHQSSQVTIFNAGQLERTIDAPNPTTYILAISCQGQLFTCSNSGQQQFTIRTEDGSRIGPRLVLPPTSASVAADGRTLLVIAPTLSPKAGCMLIVLQRGAQATDWTITSKWVGPWAQVFSVAPSGRWGLLAIRTVAGRVLLEADLQGLSLRRCAPGAYPVRAKYLSNNGIQVMELHGSRTVASIWSRHPFDALEYRVDLHSDPRDSLEDFDPHSRYGVFESPTTAPRLGTVDTQSGQRALPPGLVSFPQGYTHGDIVYLSGGPGGHVHSGYSPLVGELVRLGWKVHQPELSCHDSNARQLRDNRWATSDVAELCTYIQDVAKKRQGPVAVFGHSYGSLLALRWAREPLLPGTCLLLWGVILSVGQLWEEVPSARHLLLQYYGSEESILQDTEEVAVEQLRVPTFMIAGDLDRHTPVTPKVRDFSEQLVLSSEHQFRNYRDLPHWTRSPVLLGQLSRDIDQFLKSCHQRGEL